MSQWDRLEERVKQCTRCFIHLFINACNHWRSIIAFAALISHTSIRAIPGTKTTSPSTSSRSSGSSIAPNSLNTCSGLKPSGDLVHYILDDYLTGTAATATIAASPAVTANAAHYLSWGRVPRAAISSGSSTSSSSSRSSVSEDMQIRQLFAYNRQIGTIPTRPTIPTIPARLTISTQAFTAASSKPAQPNASLLLTANIDVTILRVNIIHVKYQVVAGKSKVKITSARIKTKILCYEKQCRALGCVATLKKRVDIGLKRLIDHDAVFEKDQTIIHDSCPPMASRSSLNS